MQGHVLLGRTPRDGLASRLPLHLIAFNATQHEWTTGWGCFFFFFFFFLCYLEIFIVIVFVKKTVYSAALNLYSFFSSWYLCHF